MPRPPDYVAVTAARAGYIGHVVRALIKTGWAITQAPNSGKLVRNQQLIVLGMPNRKVSLRVFVYKVTQSSRGRGHERRIEITSTYSGGLASEPGYNDVVLGYDLDRTVFVGLDPVRLRHGGITSNASSFLEAGGLKRNDEAPFVILLRQTRIFPEGEYQAFFRPQRIGEYLLNYDAIHSGAYDIAGGGDEGPLPRGWDKDNIGEVKRRNAKGNVLVLSRDEEIIIRTTHLSKKALKEVIDGAKKRRPRTLTPEEQRAIQQRQEQNGFLGEQFVVDYERKKLKRAGRDDLAAKVDWISRRSVSEGYDISSFDVKTGENKYIEVKSSERSGCTFDISANEWTRAKELGRKYYIYRVIDVRDDASIDLKLRNPVQLEKKGILEITASGWRVRTKGVVN